MSKIYIVIAVVVVLIGIIGGIFIFGFGKKTDSSSSVTANSNLAQIPQKETINLDTDYKDDSGLTFKYPSDATVTDITPNDNSYYTLLDIKRGGKSLRFTIKDGDFKVPTDASLVGAATLGNFSAKQYNYKSQGDDILATVAVNQGIVYLVEGPKDGGSWEDLQNAIVGSVNFGSQQSASSGSADSSSSNVVDEGEEVVE